MTVYYSMNGSSRRDHSRSLLKEAIARHTGSTKKANDLMNEIKTGKNGKPYIECFDSFSVSHSGNIWAVLFDEHECGLDIQIEKDCKMLSISSRWYDPIDAEAVRKAAAISEKDGKHKFFRIWTRREALVKALGAAVWDSELPSVSSNTVSINGREYFIHDFDFADGEGIHAAICIRKEEQEECNGGSDSLPGKPHAYRL